MEDLLCAKQHTRHCTFMISDNLHSGFWGKSQYTQFTDDKVCLKEFKNLF